MAYAHFPTNLPQLETGNFSNWKFRVEALLDEKGVKDALTCTENNFEDTKEKEDFKKRDVRAKSLIIQCISDKHLDLIKDLKTAAEMVTLLTNLFERKSIFTKLHLKKKLLLLKCGVNDKLEDHFLKFDKIIRELEQTGSKLDENDKICHLLLTLGEKYSTVITAIETVAPDKLNMDFVKSRLLDEELKTESSSKIQKENENREVTFNATQIICYKCNKTGHKSYECTNSTQNKRSMFSNRGRPTRGYKNFKSREQHRNEKANQVDEGISFVAMTCESIENKNKFILDSGATNHYVMKTMKECMTKVRKLEQPVHIKTANGHIMIAEEKGELETTCQGKKLTIEALIVEGMKNNLLSVVKLLQKGYEVIFKRDLAIIKGKDFRITGEINENNLAILHVGNEYCNQTSNSEQNLWHKRLGHLNRHGLRLLGLPASNEKCTECLQGKATRRSFNKIQTYSKEIGDLIHSDISGPVMPQTLNGEKYFQVLIDDYSHFTITNLLKSKNEAEENIKNFIHLIKTQHGKRTKKIRLDNGCEFTSNNFKSWCNKKGIQVQYTIPYSPMQNGKSERMNRTLMDKVRTKFVETNLPKTLWGEAIQCATYELNRSPTNAHKIKEVTPASVWYGKKDLSKLKIFGSKMWIVNLPKGNKLEPRSKQGIMVGYCGGGYRAWDPSINKVIRTTDVTFDENCINFNYFYSEKRHLNESENNEKIESNDRKEEENENNDEKSSIDTKEEKSIEQDNENITRKGRLIRKPNYLNEYEIYSAYCLLTNEKNPNSYEEAIQDKEWKISIEKEMSSHKKLGTWIEAALPIGKTAIDSKWVFKTKEDGTKKARLVAKGFQIEKEDPLNPLYAPVARMATIRMIMSLATQQNWELKQLDIPTAFLNGTLETDIYIKPPRGINVNKDKVLKLNRALYGLRDSPKCWNNKFDTVANSYGFKRSDHDFCLYCNEHVWLIIYVDDIVVTGKSKEIQKTVKWLKDEFNAKEMGDIKEFLGMSIKRDEHSLKINQSALVSKVLKLFNMEDCHDASTPMEPGFKYDNGQIIDVPYRQLIGSLMYLATTTRPDIMFSVSYLSRFLDKPTENTWKAAKRVLRYLKGTKDLGLNYSKSDSALKTYSDADWAGDDQDRKSISGSMTFYSGNPISWFSKKQECVSLSSVESEYIAAASSAQDLVYLKGILSDFNVTNNKNVLLVDNVGTICMAKNYENSKRTKHIDIKFHFIKDLLAKNVITLEHVRSDQNVADMLTKPLCKTKFEIFRNVCLESVECY